MNIYDERRESFCTEQVVVMIWTVVYYIGTRDRGGTPINLEKKNVFATDDRDPRVGRVSVTI